MTPEPIASSTEGKTRLAEVQPGSLFQKGYILPKDVRVRFVRAESACLDTILSLLYSSLFTVFGVFLGINLTKGKNSTPVEISATVIFGVFSIIILIWWGINKWRQYSNSISVPPSILENISEE
jgi:hypothetical protein